MLILATLSLLPPTWFPFVIPWDDATAGTANDMSFLNAKPAGKGGRIVVKNGVFVEEKTGKRVRFFGTNLGARAAFPSKREADRIAARLSKLGVNIVRFHHLQNDWDKDGGTIWNESKMQMELDPKQLDKLDYFFAALKRQGIYTNMNLQTTRKYLPAMGFPDSVLQIPFDFGKKIDKVNRRMIALQKEYASQLLDRVNPYTKLKYNANPALAVIEINNENSLVGWPGESPGAGLTRLPQPFLGEVEGRWNAWLAKTYGTDASLRAAWTKGITPEGTPFTGSTSKWSWENQSNGDVTFTPSPRSESGLAPDLKVQINSNAGPDWHVQVHLVGLDFKDGETYNVQFQVLSSQKNPIRPSATLDQDDWHNVGLDAPMEVGPEWRTVRLPFVARSTRPNHNRVAISVGNARGTLEFKDVRIAPGLGGAVVPAGASLANRSIPLPEGGTNVQMRDYTRFLTEVESQYAEEMRQYLRKGLGFKSNLVDTQVQWGGLTAFAREKGSDFADSHAYWQHPSFGAQAWSPKDWTIENTPLTARMRGDGGTLGSLAGSRVAGMPFAVSEYDHPAPSDYRVEMMPMVSTFGAFQDWDVVYSFAYTTTGESKFAANDTINGFFDQAVDPMKVAFLPAAALTFRLGLVPPAPAMVTAIVPQDRPWETAFNSWDVWKNNPGGFLSHRMAMRTGPVNRVTYSTKASTKGKPSISAPSPEAYAVDTPHVKAYTGAFRGKTFSAGDGVNVVFADNAPKFGALMLVASDGKPLSKAKRYLLTIASRAENLEMGWNATRTSVSDQWGKGPVHCEGVASTVSLGVPKGAKVFALDSRGKRVRPVSVTRFGGRLYFKTSPSYRTLWYEIAR